MRSGGSELLPPAELPGAVKRATGLGGVFFRAKDPETLARWYADHLGLEVGGAEHGSHMALFAWKERGRGGAEGITVWAAFPRNTTYFGAPRQSMMVNYIVDDLEALLQQLRREGVRTVKRMEVSAYGKFGWVEDPEGNRVELWEPPKPKRRRAPRSGRRSKKA